MKWTLTRRTQQSIQPNVASTEEVSKATDDDDDQKKKKDTICTTGFTLESATASDAGKYTCEIANAVGRASTSCYVDVVDDEKVFRSYQRAKR